MPRRRVTTITILLLDEQKLVLNREGIWAVFQYFPQDFPTRFLQTIGACLARFGCTCKQNFSTSKLVAANHGALVFYYCLTNRFSSIYSIFAIYVLSTFAVRYSLFAVRSSRNTVNPLSHRKKQPQHPQGKERPQRRRSGPRERSKTRPSTLSSLTRRPTIAS
jgi:hypothetical protein